MNFIKKNKYLLILIGLFLGQFLLISPRGEFPLNDDWVHAEMIKHWLDTGSFRLNPYTGPLLFLPIAYGFALAKIFGFSFTLFRISTLVIALLLTIGTYWLAKKKSDNAMFAFFAALVVWLNPLVYNLSFSFMTDVPALGLLLLAIICFTLAQEKNDWKYMFFGAAAAVLGFYTRQTNILILAAFGLYVLCNGHLRNLKNIVALGIPVVAGAAVYWWMHNHSLIPEGGSYHTIKEGYGAIARHFFWWSWYSVLYLGLFTLPLTISLWQKHWRDKKYWLAAGLGLLIPLILYWWREELFPYVPNMISQWGLGPFSDVLQGSYLPLFRKRIWFAVSLASGIGAVLLAWILWQAKTIRGQGWLWLFAGFFILPILFLSSFDRYFMPLFLAMVIIVAGLFKNIKIGWSSWAILGIIALYSIAQTQFYMNWNRTRADLYQAGLHAIQTTPQFTKIDGGYEWTGYLGYWSARQHNIGRGPENSPWWIKFLMTNNTMEYVVSASPFPKYEIVIKKTVPGWNPNDQLYLLRKSK